MAVPAVLSGCRGCGSTPSEPPTHFVAKDAEVVVEVRDVRTLVRLREALAHELGAFITTGQVDSLRQELALTLGFDPSTDDGLKKAGVRTEGQVAVQLEDGGRSAMWVIPVDDAAKFKQTVHDAAAARVGANKTTVEGEITLYQGEFGPQLVTVAACAVARGAGLVGAGPKAKEMVAAALLRKPEDSVASHPEYAKQVGALGQSWDVRAISPSGARAVVDAVQLIMRRPGFVLPAGLGGLVSAGWSLDAKPTGLEMQGRLRLDEGGMERARKLFTGAKAPAGIRALDVPAAAAVLQVGGDPSALIAMLAPPGSANRAELDRFFERVKSDVGTDPEHDVIPLLSGHGAVSVGAGDLSRLTLMALQRNPMSALWTVFAVGTKDEETIKTIEQRLDPGLKARQFEISTRNAAGQDVRVVAQVDPTSGARATLVETFGKAGAMVFSNEPAITNSVVANAGGRDLLAGVGGLALELRFGVLAQQLKTFPIAALPALFRAIARKIVDAVALLDVATLQAKLAPDGIDLHGELKLAIAPKSE